MRTYVFLLVIAIFIGVFYLWSPFHRAAESEVYAAKEGQLLLPQRNVAIVTLTLDKAGLKFTESGDLLGLRPLHQDFVEIDGATKVESILNASRVISEGDEIIVARLIPGDDSEVTDLRLEQIAGEIHEFPELSPYIDEELNTLLFYISFANRTSSQAHSSRSDGTAGEVERLPSLRIHRPVPGDRGDRIPSYQRHHSVFFRFSR